MPADGRTSLLELISHPRNRCVTSTCYIHLRGRRIFDCPPPRRWGNPMVSREEFVARLTRAAPYFLRYIFIFQVIAGLLSLASPILWERHISISFALESGRPGKSSATNSSTSRAHPEAALHYYWLYAHCGIPGGGSRRPISRLAGSQIAGTANVSVIVLYDPVNPLPP